MENAGFTTASNLSGPGAASHTAVISQSHKSKTRTDTAVPMKRSRRLAFSYTTTAHSDEQLIYTLFKPVDHQKT